MKPVRACLKTRWAGAAKEPMPGVPRFVIPAKAGIWRLDIFWSGEAHPGSAGVPPGVPPAIVAAGHRSG
ncbi:MAG: hypothetical protein L0387_16400, partial [Acidobacteria bacterium]|nr:hypothetical protein [Acidobacteriota bacterium]